MNWLKNSKNNKEQMNKLKIKQIKNEWTDKFT